MGKDVKITVEDVVVQKTGLLATDLDGEVVMMNVDKGKYYCFNAVASRIWEIVEKPMKVKEIISHLLTEFEVEEANCRVTVMSFLEKLYKEDIILVN